MRATSNGLLAAACLTICGISGANAGSFTHSFGFRFVPFAHHAHVGFMHTHFDHDGDIALPREFRRRNAELFLLSSSVLYAPPTQWTTADTADPPSVNDDPTVLYSPLVPRPVSSAPKIIIISAEQQVRPAGKLPIVIYGTTGDH